MLSYALLTCEGFYLGFVLQLQADRGFKNGIRGRLCFASLQLQADRNSSPFVSLLNKRIYKFKVAISKVEIYYFANFKISFTPKNLLLKFGFAYRLAQILEPKLLVHEILKFAQIH